MINLRHNTGLTYSRFRQSWISRPQSAGFFVALLVLMSLAIPVQSAQLTEQINSVTERCMKTVLEVGGYRGFRGAEFLGILDDGVHVAEGDIDVFLRLRTKEIRRRSDQCSFEAEDVTEREFGMHAASLSQVAEHLGLSRVRPATTTNFTYAGCIEDDIKGPTSLEIKTVYLRKSKVTLFRVESSFGGFSNCGN
ncbi:hypothetical protein [Ruegeria sp. YS9]|uniref:hypothetical protein n=1 Tax=Ruegeria sp. YS9 TaxID=2966453 RepID=UPI00214AFA18|nr:hypothetical protein [Ruegeria sp. YS9]UUV06043.1 hypothetical protein NOR97_15715 [Ruegeria sp. YS9]